MSAPGQVIKVVNPAKIRERMQTLSEDFLQGAYKPNGEAQGHYAPLDHQRDAIRRGLFHGVGGLFPTQAESGKVIHSGKRANARPADVQPGGKYAQTIAWNITLLLGYLFGREGQPFRAIQTKDLNDGEWYALCRWAGMYTEAQPRWTPFYIEALWTANRGLWCYTYSRRFYHQPPLAQILREMHRAYGADVPGLPFAQDGMLENGLALRGEIPHLPGNWTSDETVYREMVTRWQAFATAGDRAD